jgi:predicted nucleic acid-binding protein
VTFLVDTGRLINALADRGAALDVLEALSDRGLAVSVVSLGELYDGVVGRPDEAAGISIINRFLRNFTLMTLVEPTMLTFVRLRRQLHSQGEPLATMDLLIAATAVTTNRTLITHNRRHFERVPGLKIY